MRDAPLSLTRAFRRFRRRWNTFFLQPQDLRICGLIRITFAALILANYFSWWPRLELWFSDTGIMPRDVAIELTGSYAFSIFYWLPNTETVLWCCYSVAIGQASLLLLGIWPRLQALSTFVWLVSFHHRNPLLWDGEDFLMRLMCFYLILMPLDQIWAIGFPWRVSGFRSTIRETPRAPVWALRLLQLQIALILLVAGTSKLYGRAWVEGDALYYVARLHEFFPRFPVPGFLFDTPWIVKVLTWSVIAMEILVPLLVWFKETRRWALLVALLFHLASDYSMNLFLFHWFMLVGWMSFLTTEDLERVARIWRKPVSATSPTKSNSNHFGSKT